MKNQATVKQVDKFNAFTRFLFNAIKQGKAPLVRLRDGRIVSIKWFTEDGPEYEHFLCDDGDMYLIWDNDGVSITADRFDMMETV